jgi:hypothetical protein
VLESAGDPEQELPYGGTLFGTTGHYGSTAFDPMNGDRIIITVCDECLTANKNRVMFQEYGLSADKRKIWEGED